MASATMGLRRRVHPVTSASATSSSGSSSSGKRGRSSENNNSPSQGNLNSLESPSAAKKSRTATLRSRTKELEMQQKKGPPHWSDPRPYASIAGLSLEAQAALCNESVNLPSPISYMSSTMATFVGNATARGSPISYLDISNMTGPRSGWPADAFGPFGPHPACTVTSAAHAAAAAAAAVAMATPSTSSTTTSTTTGSSDMTVQSQKNQRQEQQQVPMNFPNDAMFGAYQPWVIKTYGDLAKTKTITIKKYARILRTLRGEEVNSAENSKFRFWVKSKGFHVGQPEGYEAKPADRIIGRHAVTNPGLDPPLYVPTQPPHNKTLNGAENSSVPGRVYKKVAIVENFFDIIHAVHVDLEGRPGKHAGQKRTYRTITETYAFLPREAVTRFLLGCTECQRRPRTPSPSTNAAATPPPPSTTTPGSSTSTTATDTCGKQTVEESKTTTTQEVTSSSPRSSPKPATALSSTRTPSPTSVPPKEASHPPASSLSPERQPKSDSVTETSSCTSITTTSTSSTKTNSSASRIKDEKYNPLSITNLLRKDPVPRRPPLPLVLHQPTLIGPPCIVPSTTQLAEADAPSAFHKVVRTTPPLPAPAPCIPITSLHSGADAVARTLHYAVSSLQPFCPPKTTLAPTTSHLPTNLTTTTTTTIPVAVTGRESEQLRKKDTDVEVDKKVKKENVEANKENDNQAEVEVIGVVEKNEHRLKEKVTETTTNVKVEVKKEDEEEQAQRSFSPTAGLIDTNLNLLATIQQLHCQVMLALTQRLCPVSVSDSSKQTTVAASTDTSNSTTGSTKPVNPESS